MILEEKFPIGIEYRRDIRVIGARNEMWQIVEL